MGQTQTHPARVLVVDDNERNLLAMRATLEPLGEEVICVSSGAEALKALLRAEFALILLDVQMPVMNGIETASLIRMRERTRLVPIILFTAHDSLPSLIARGYEHGAVDYLIKPVDPSILRSKVWFFVELWRRGRQLEERARDVARAEAAEAHALEGAEFERRLLGIVSHDIRSPLTAVKATAKKLLKDGAKDEAQQRALLRIVRGTSRMEQLTALFLDVSRARWGGGIRLSLKDADMRELCQSAVDELQAVNPDSRIELLFDDGDSAGVWDPLRIHQVLTNLLSNAVKYGDSAAGVQVRCAFGGPLVTISVHNDGEPIAPALQSILFEPFTRGGHPESTVHESVGLGLYIVREIVRAHGGAIAVESKQGSGTTFSVTIPRVTQSHEERHGSPAH